MIVRADTRGDRISLTAKYVRDDPCERGMPTAAGLSTTRRWLARSPRKAPNVRPRHLRHT
jgi:hypothetical protein